MLNILRTFEYTGGGGRFPLGLLWQGEQMIMILSRKLLKLYEFLDLSV